MTYFLIIRGSLCSGKTTIAERLANELGAMHVAVDHVLDEHSLANDHEDGYISQRSFIKANEIISTGATSLLAAGTPVIFDGNFYWQSQIEDLISRLDFAHEVYTLTVPLDVCVERDRNRSKTHGPDAAGAVYEKSTSFGYGVSIDATGSINATIVLIKSKLPGQV